MKTIPIEDDLYEYLLGNATTIGESASEILRRLLRRPAHTNERKRRATASSAPAQRGASEISGALADARYQGLRKATDRFLYLLSWACNQDPKAFERVLAVGGRKRKYFARSEGELSNSGRSVNPKPIPGTPFWVVTNSDTPKKQDMLGEALKMLGYSAAMIAEAKLSLVG